MRTPTALESLFREIGMPPHQAKELEWILDSLTPTGGWIADDLAAALLQWRCQASVRAACQAWQDARVELEVQAARDEADANEVCPFDADYGV